MFERRLKIFFGILIGVIALLIIRAGQIQILEADSWREKAEDSMRRTTYTKTIRGRILDYRGRELAVDAPCLDAAVDFRAIVKNERWIRDQALSRLQNNVPEYKSADKADRQRMLEAECLKVSADIDKMFNVLAEESGQTREEIEQIKQSIRQRVEIRQRVVWYNRYSKDLEKRQPTTAPDEPADSDPWYSKFILSEEPLPQIDNFGIEISEQTEPHVILPAVTPEVHNRLKKKIDQYPGLSLIPSVHRYYPYNETACHIIGTLSLVQKKEDPKRGAQDLRQLYLQSNPWADQALSGNPSADPMNKYLANDPALNDPRKQYLPNDLAGRWGVEALCEETLRGKRGKIEKNTLNDEITEEVLPENGKDIRLTIDIELQRELEANFRNFKFYDRNNYIGEHAMYGGAAVIDLKSGQLRALVSYPTFNLNDYSQDYSKLVADVINRPLLNRATQGIYEPGSTVKPLVALGALISGKLKLSDRIECKGFLVIDGKKQQYGRCWTMSTWYNELGLNANHEHVPSTPGAQHPDGHLNVVDAIERSCNVFFENMGDRMEQKGLAENYMRFGLGKTVGIGISENPGRVPAYNLKNSKNDNRMDAWFSAIGQSGVRATPLQIANAHATIARDGVWVRPTLVSEGLPETALKKSGPDRVDLHISPDYIRAVKEGMNGVVNKVQGSAHSLNIKNPTIAGKTGTAQASLFSYPVKDENGKTVLKALPFPDPDLPWYSGAMRPEPDRNHAWFVGFAPYDHPKIAFAVLVEYGGGGSTVAGHYAKSLLEACLKNGYL